MTYKQKQCLAACHGYEGSGPTEASYKIQLCTQGQEGGVNLACAMRNEGTGGAQHTQGHMIIPCTCHRGGLLKAGCATIDTWNELHSNYCRMLDELSMPRGVLGANALGGQ